MKNFFSDKSSNFRKNTLVEKNISIISEYNQKIADIFTEYFETLVPKLGLAIPKDAMFATNDIEDPVRKAMHKYQRLPSILAIKEKYKNLIFFLCKFI